ncbi:hypothetical protein KZZ52_49940 [Dactylosporangium sp. AC04546]|uniref:hypothetical protein n=1 Tax=Dactylosporangium sp. AC04546 TaxID=2862460 RepID=UPI001EDDEA26|nr:hypothetical protein [Dactylosporangium sp. AC04546]WVK82007.1 hypothetical protein KZZ52_49940 [Dactylosporangium sp. AC04546]
MQVLPEIWPVAADGIGIWLISGRDAWRPRLPVMADSEPHAEVELELSDQNVRNDVTFLHSTSWRVDGPRLIVTYLAVVDRPGFVRDHWSDALPVSINMVAAVGKPPTHAPDEAPAPRYIDVLLHGLRHLSFLVGPNGDGTARTVLSDDWKRHLSQFEPALAGMYSGIYGEAA